MASYTITITVSDDKYCQERNPDLPAPEVIKDAIRHLVDYMEDGRENFQKEKIREAAGLLFQEAMVHAINREEIQKMGDKANTETVDVGDNIKVSKWSMNAEDRLKKIGKIYPWPTVEVKEL